MKKTLSLLLTLVLLFGIATNMTACDKKTELTTANVNSYIKFRVWDDYKTVYGGFTTGPTMQKIELFFGASAEGTSSNFNYNEVCVTLRIYGTYELAKMHTYDFEGTEDFEVFITLNLNISGSTTESAHSNVVINTFDGRLVEDRQRIASCDFDYEIYSISGYLTAA